jgi:hypothetical protein
MQKITKRPQNKQTKQTDEIGCVQGGMAADKKKKNRKQLLQLISDYGKVGNRR